MKEVSRVCAVAAGEGEERTSERLLLDVHLSFSVCARRLQLADLESSGTHALSH